MKLVFGGKTKTIDTIIEDVRRRPIILLSDRGHGKSTSLMTIVQELKRKYPKVICKAMDISQAWYWKAPLKHRQKITSENLFKVNFINLDDCVYEMGSLNKEERRLFVSLIISQDYRVRYEMGMRFGIDSVKKLPLIIYILEEASCYFGSYSLRKNDACSPVLNDFVSVGRNYGLGAFMVVTAETGELSPSLRRRSTRLIGQVSNDYDMRMLNRKSKGMGAAALMMPRFHWIYFNGEESESFRIRDEVNAVPKDYTFAPKSAPLVIPEPSEFELSPVAIAILALFVGALLAMWFL